MSAFKKFEKSAEVPEVLAEQLREINRQWFPNNAVEVTAYQQSGRNGNWRFALYDRLKKEFIMESIDPSEAKGHLLLMASVAIKEARDQGQKEGSEWAIEKLTRAAHKIVFGN
jgi:hypothetical protein